MIYLASPYSHPSPNVRELRFRKTAEFMLKQAAKGTFIFSPIVYLHSISWMIPETFDVQAFDDRCLRACSSLWVLKLPGWEESVGIRHELALAQKLELPVTFLEHNFADV